MIAYKGFNKDIQSVRGNNDPSTSNFTLGQTLEVESSKTAVTGFHCCEYPFDCLIYYSLDGSNRFFKVEAAGDIDEDKDHRIACTRITLLEELDTMALAYEAMKYMLEHPKRDGWCVNRWNVLVSDTTTKIEIKDGIAISRAKRPVVYGVEGSILGLITEDESGIVHAKLIRCSKEYERKYLSLDKDRAIVILDTEGAVPISRELEAEETGYKEGVR